MRISRRTMKRNRTPRTRYRPQKPTRVNRASPEWTVGLAPADVRHALARGVNTYRGSLTNEAVAQAHGLEWTPVSSVIHGAAE